ncbi:MAG: TolB family protein, partial [Flavobacteriales bacterium]
IAFGGVRGGQSDLYVFNTLAGSQVPLWEDPWDDLHPDWLPDGSGLVFSSNRPDGWDTLAPWPVPATRDLWVYHLDEERFERLTDTPARDEVRPQALG